MFEVLGVRDFQTVILFVRYVGMFLHVLCILFVKGLYGLHVGEFASSPVYFVCQRIVWFTCRRVSSGHVYFVSGFYVLGVGGFLHV